MNSTIIKEITQKALDTYLKARQFGVMYWPDFFPLKQVLDLDYLTLIGEQENRIIADVISYDASAPLKSRQVVKKREGEIPKLAVKRKMKEKDMNDYLKLARLASPGERAILDLIYNDIDFVVEAVLGRMEWIVLQAMSKTKLSFTLSNNNGIVTESAIDFLMPTANKSGAEVIWSVANKATAKPISDIKAIVATARTAGVQLQNIWMTPACYDIFVVCDEVINYIKAFYRMAAADVMTLENLTLVNRALADNRLPTINLIDTSIGIESKAGAVVWSNPYDTNYVLLTPSVQLGNFLNGPIAEEIRPPKNVIQSKAGNVLVSKFSKVDPISEFTKGEANCFPSWGNINKCYSLKKSATSWS